jgi:hypothetical protein
MSFLEIIRNSQPLVFLASLAFVIAALILRNNQDELIIYDYAVVAALMFIFSFISSILQQLPFSGYESVRPYVSFTTYFFLAIGIINLLLIAYELGKGHSQIFLFVTAWSFLLPGIIAIYIIIMFLNIIRKGKKQLTSDVRKIIIAALVGIPLLFYGLLSILQAL